MSRSKRIIVCDIRNDEGLRFRKDEDILPCITEHIHKDGGVNTVVLLWKFMIRKKYYQFKMAHGWFCGGCKETDVICTIDSGIGKWHTLILEELVETNEIIERERERVPIKNNSKQGFLYAYDGDGIDLGVNRKNHRGSVKHGISHTIKTGIDCGVIEIGNERGTS